MSEEAPCKFAAAGKFLPASMECQHFDPKHVRCLHGGGVSCSHWRRLTDQQIFGGKLGRSTKRENLQGYC